MTTYYWKIKARDNHNTESESPVWSYTTGNMAPSIPTYLMPRERDKVFYENVYLNWQGSDEDLGDKLLYDVYFGTSSSPPLVQNDTPDVIYEIGELLPDTTYYWKIIAKDRYGGVTEGPEQSFQTLGHLPVVLNTQISSNTILSAENGPYLVTSGFSVALGTTLTIEAGTIIKIGMGLDFNVKGALIAQGTEENPIIITSSNDDFYGGDTNADGDDTRPENGDWNRLWFNNSADASHLSNVFIVYGGGSNSSNVKIEGGSTIINNCVISNSGNHGISMNMCSATITNNTFENNNNLDIYTTQNFTGTIADNTINSELYLVNDSAFILKNNVFNLNGEYPIHLHANKIGDLLSTNTITHVTADSYLEVVGGNISHDATWTALMPFHILGTITVQGKDGDDGVTTLTIDPDAELRFNPSVYLNVGASASPGALSAVGTEESPIVFTSNREPQAAGDWYGIQFQDTSDDTLSIMEHCIVEYAGYGSGGRLIAINNASPTLKQCTLRYSQGDGIYIAGNPSLPHIIECSISRCQRYGINVASGAASIANNTLTGNSNFDIYLNNSPLTDVTGNTLSTGLYVTSGDLATITGNTLEYDNGGCQGSCHLNRIYFLDFYCSIRFFFHLDDLYPLSFRFWLWLNKKLFLLGIKVILFFCI
ncbi:MAG: right-handed parallel beta-helix repeat-containing protein, partial [Proteobacteria bacterium]|nr:right-handed parallel beta-helix repeat-containing protein [Pseudomonadota bacterium]